MVKFSGNDSREKKVWVRIGATVFLGKALRKFSWSGFGCTSSFCRWVAWSGSHKRVPATVCWGYVRLKIKGENGSWNIYFIFSYITIQNSHHFSNLSLYGDLVKMSRFSIKLSDKHYFIFHLILTFFKNKIKFFIWNLSFYNFNKLKFEIKGKLWSDQIFFKVVEIYSVLWKLFESQLFWRRKKIKNC